MVGRECGNFVYRDYAGMIRGRPRIFFPLCRFMVRLTMGSSGLGHAPATDFQCGTGLVDHIRVKFSYRVLQE